MLTSILIIFLEGDTVLHLKVLEVRKDPPLVLDDDVPILVSSVGLPKPGRPPKTPPNNGQLSIKPSEDQIEVDVEEPFYVDMDANWDLTTRQVAIF